MTDDDTDEQTLNWRACGHVGPQSYACELPEDHEGTHAAFIESSEQPAVRWADE